MNEVFKAILISIIPYFTLISAECAEKDLDPVLVSAQIKAESNFQPDAISPAGAMGLMQIMPQTAKWLKFNPVVLIDPEINIAIGTYYDAWLYQYWRGKDGYTQGLLDALVMASYNAGQGRVKRKLRHHNWFEQLPGETKTYVRRIFSYRLDYLILIAERLKNDQRSR